MRNERRQSYALLTYARTTSHSTRDHEACSPEHLITTVLGRHPSTIGIRRTIGIRSAARQAEGVSCCKHCVTRCACYLESVLRVRQSRSTLGCVDGGQ
jgi:hypothetical protein